MIRTTAVASGPDIGGRVVRGWAAHGIRRTAGGRATRGQVA
jgi:hypothetical protein